MLCRCIISNVDNVDYLSPAKVCMNVIMLVVSVNIQDADHDHNMCSSEKFVQAS